MLAFENDYSEGAHEKILQRLMETNRVQQPGYGNDEYSQSAKEKIRAACQCPNADIYFLVGGTQTNALTIAAYLGPAEGVVSVQTGHVNLHEAGAIEYTGHKVMPLPAHDGKMDAGELEIMLRDFYADPTYPHMVHPGMVYISHPTEYGTLYTKAELQALSAVCRKYQIPLFLDGARLGYGLMSVGTDVTLPIIAAYCDAFYIGGTKVGALCGEALVFPRNNAPRRFFTQVKMHGALVAKGRLVGLQFDTLFTDDLYLEISRHAIEMAQYMKKGIAQRGYQFHLDSPTNQQFVVLDNEKMKKLEKQVRFSFWEKVDDDHSVVRFATSWATRKEDVDELFKLLD
ncbi:MAG: low specificity L-threonine aldolase [Clostridia bacterium]|nr:low specificity L-threonine aldolase [Clostridia bacterium]MBQ6804162.1 low specificity L-threonine aldolase [Clostridia bacterium]